MLQGEKNMLKICSEYFCEMCNYRCSRKFLWKQHLETKKHLRNIVNKTENLSTETEFACETCGKYYKERTGLWKHKKKCIKGGKNTEKNEIVPSHVSKKNHDSSKKINMEGEELKEMMNVIINSVGKDSDFKNGLMRQLEEQNKIIKEQMVIHDVDKEEMMKQIKEQNKIIQELVPQVGSNNNNRVNINVFLNEHCRDAINMSEFLASLQVQLKDLEYTQNNGIVEGISSVLVNGLRQLDTYKRPIHCTDMKRETLYIKENNEWDKECGKEVLLGAINDVAHKQRQAIAEWEEKHPDWSKSDSGKDEYIKLVKTVMSDISSEQKENKIIKTIAKETIIKN
tara:strand:- start:911 stop:1930 length:1020 start_codon:yes stop_codon:yes gene_type:complete